MRRFCHLPGAWRTRMATHCRLLSTDPLTLSHCYPCVDWNRTNYSQSTIPDCTLKKRCDDVAFQWRRRGMKSFWWGFRLLSSPCSFKFRHKIPGTPYLFVFLWVCRVLIAASYTQSHVYCTPPTGSWCNSLRRLLYGRAGCALFYRPTSSLLPPGVMRTTNQRLNSGNACYHSV
jgi:hypothetical protein